MALEGSLHTVCLAKPFSRLGTTLDKQGKAQLQVMLVPQLCWPMPVHGTGTCEGP